MSECPLCKTPGAYVGFNSIECRNPSCEHFSINQEKVCPCCGRLDHHPGQDGSLPPLIDEQNDQSTPNLSADGSEEPAS